MALRTVREYGDPVLTKECKPVREVTEHIRELIDDMFETMYEKNGCGLAAPQVGILRQISVIDVDDGNQYVLINPEVLETSGEQRGSEGCLSYPGKAGMVTRPSYVKVRALDENLEEQIIEGEGLLARCLLHEIDHLHGHFYTELVEGEVFDVDYSEDEED